ncbi:MAG: hypothetical protein CMB67_05120 [Euryarchaeota archaeon]|nr:hypothetical protein [Euryarchaeota archaeon]
MNVGHRSKSAIVFLLLAISLVSPVVSSQDEQTGKQTFQFHTIASLGDSTLGSDPTGYRGPFASIHAANLMELDYYEGAVGGDRSWTLINAGRHTSIAENYSAGTLVTMMVGAWDFIDSDINIVDGDYSFIDNLEENITIILDTLVASEIDVLVWNLPNMSFLPFLTQIFPTEVHPHFTEASLLWANRLDEIADRYGESVQIFDLMSASDDLLQNKSARELGSNEVISPPEMCEKNCIMVDSLHPTSVGQGLLANYMMVAINEKFPSPNGDYPLLSEEDLLALADFSLSEQPNEVISIDGDITKACFDWSESSYRQMYLSISNNGEDIPVPSYIGFNTELCRQSTHVMYSGESSVNIISNIENNLTLNHFFEIWGKNFSSQQIMDLAVSEGGSLTLFLDGVEYNGDWGSIPLEGVISIEIKLSNPVEDIVGEEEPSRTPGFSVILSGFALLLASSRAPRRFGQ